MKMNCKIGFFDGAVESNREAEEGAGGFGEL